MKRVTGKVKSGAKRGKDLGFPTVNLSLHKNISSGIYISKTRVNGVIYPSLSFVGEAKTFNESNYQLETYLLDKEINLYGKWISVELIKKIRENKKFKNAHELVKAMKEDERIARVYWDNKG
jgi:riboflavin kinase / FMN adenylyltransferase